MEQTREQWLNKAAGQLARRVFKPAALALPEKLRVSCGWPSKKALSPNGRALAQCFDAGCSDDGTIEVFVSPVLAERLDVLAAFTHELLHAAVGPDAKHGSPFKQGMAAIGLEGKATSTEVHKGSALWEKLEATAEAVGEYPHARLDKESLPKQSTRLLKVECPKCGYTVRVTHKWLDVGTPTCCCGTKMKETEV